MERIVIMQVEDKTPFKHCDSIHECIEQLRTRTARAIKVTQNIGDVNSRMRELYTESMDLDEYITINTLRHNWACGIF